MKFKKKKLSGITLVELVIVLAIFSGIAVGALAMIRPALQLYRRSTAEEKAIASIDSIGRYIQDNIRYADNIMIYANTGIEKAVTYNGEWNNQFCNYPFAYKAFNIEYQIQKTEKLNNVIVIANQGVFDLDKFINPVAYFIKYHFTESLCFKGSEAKFSELKVRQAKQCHEYFKDKVVYLMEIRETGEVNVYEFPLKNNIAKYDAFDSLSDNDPELDLFMKEWSNYNSTADPIYYCISNGQMSVFCNAKESNPIKSYSINSEFFNEKIKVNGEWKNRINLESVALPGGETFPGSASGGMTFEFSYLYEGGTGVIKSSHNVAVSFANVVDKKTHFVNDTYYYDADTFQYFDCDGKQINHETGAKGKKGGSIFIVYSLPEIIP